MKMNEQSTTKGFAVLSVASMIVKVLSLLYIPFLRSIIGDEGYGVYGAAYQVYVFIFVLTNSGIPVAISKLISELVATKNYKDAIKSFKIARFVLLVIGIIMSLIMLVFAYPLAKAINYKKAYLSILALAPAVLFTSIASAYRGYFQGRGNMTPTAVSQVIEQAINTIFTLVFAALFIKYGIAAGCAGGTIGTSLGALFSAWYLINVYKKNKKFKVSKEDLNLHIRRYTNKQILKKIINYGVPITLCVGMTYAGNIVDVANTKTRLIVAGLTESNASILYGYLVKYQQLLNVPISIIASLAMAILPAIAGAAAQNNKNEVEDKINYSFRLSFLVAIPSAIGLSVLSEPIFFTLGFGKGSFLMRYGSIVLILSSIMQIQTTILQSIGKLYTATTYSVIGILFKIIINYILIAIPQINIMGAIIGSVVGFLIPVILNHKIIKKTLNIRFNFLTHATKPFIASISMAVIAYIVYYDFNFLLKLEINKLYISNAIATVVAIITGVFVYLFTLIFIGGIREKD
jgi:stage V sporulation protein B